MSGHSCDYCKGSVGDACLMHILRESAGFMCAQCHATAKRSTDIEHKDDCSFRIPRPRGKDVCPDASTIDHLRRLQRLLSNADNTVRVVLDRVEAQDMIPRRTVVSMLRDVACEQREVSRNIDAPHAIAQAEILESIADDIAKGGTR